MSALNSMTLPFHSDPIPTAPLESPRIHLLTLNGRAECAVMGSPVRVTLPMRATLNHALVTCPYCIDTAGWGELHRDWCSMTGRNCREKS